LDCVIYYLCPYTYTPYHSCYSWCELFYLLCYPCCRWLLQSPRLFL